MTFYTKHSNLTNEELMNIARSSECHLAIELMTRLMRAEIAIEEANDIIDDLS